MTHKERGVDLAGAVWLLSMFRIMQIALGRRSGRDCDGYLGVRQPSGLEVRHGAAETVYLLWAIGTQSVVESRERSEELNPLGTWLRSVGQQQARTSLVAAFKEEEAVLFDPCRLAIRQVLIQQG